jgi:organic hydroperoxide reductase OsmC/OhrA
MSHHGSRLEWSRNDQTFTDRRYSRVHRIAFDGGVEFSASSSPQVVPVPYSDPTAVDPEALFVAALSSCHLLWFLDLACRAGWCVDRYVDDADGELARDADGRLAMTRVTLRPRVRFAGVRQPDGAELARLHEAAHAECFIARSVRTDVRCEPQP